MSRNEWNAPVEREDIESELYLFLFRKPTLLNSKPSTVFGTLYRHATDTCFRMRKQTGAVLLGHEALGAILREWHSMPDYVWDVVYGPTFSKAAGGRYLALLEQVYRDSRDMLDMTPEERLDPIRTMRKLLPASDRQALRAALDRLAEVLGDVMCGRPESFDVAKHDQEDQTDYLAANETDETFYPHRGTYVCAQGHQEAYTLATWPPQRIGMPREYGYRNCHCGDESLALAAA
ncbi:hypothetical protein O7630_06660 [Micromonospora sp. WMMD718]|uniref:hypothetical protein n=1 Tax=unclassified Micromonospora TaxID=2617518 RepID=UPI00128E41B4|nr:MULTISPECIES: hypothetical protein [unclassified Micromonospora]MDG4750612.1 hypothetical protein [Micromonospora sp. WMMD718]